MNASVDLPTPSLQQVVDHIFASRKITRADQRCFMCAALTDCSLSQEDKALIDRVFDELRRGRLRVVN